MLCIIACVEFPDLPEPFRRNRQTEMYTYRGDLDSLSGGGAIFVGTYIFGKLVSVDNIKDTRVLEYNNKIKNVSQYSAMKCKKTKCL